MSTITFDTLKANRNLKAAGIAEAQADAFTDTVATKADIARLEGRIDSGLANLKAEVFRALWIQGAGIIAIQLAIAGLLFAAIRFLSW